MDFGKGRKVMKVRLRGKEEERRGRLGEEECLVFEELGKGRVQRNRKSKQQRIS